MNKLILSVIVLMAAISTALADNRPYASYYDRHTNGGYEVARHGHIGVGHVPYRPVHHHGSYRPYHRGGHYHCGRGNLKWSDVAKIGALGVISAGINGTMYDRAVRSETVIIDRTPAVQYVTTPVATTTVVNAPVSTITTTTTRTTRIGRRYVPSRTEVMTDEYGRTITVRTPGHFEEYEY